MFPRKQTAPEAEGPRKVPYVRFDYFLKGFDPAARYLFYMLLGALVAGIAWLLVAQAWPEWFSITLVQVSDDSGQTVVLQRMKHDYRQVEYLANAYFSFIRYAAGPIEVKWGVLLAFALLQTLGWAAVLTASSKIRSWHVYILYAVLALHIGLMGVPQVLLGADPFRLVSLVVIVLLLGPAYAFRAEVVMLRQTVQFAVFCGLQLLIYGVCWFEGGKAGLHHVLTYDTPLLVLLSVVGIFFVAKDLPNLIVYALNNRPKPEQRLSLQWVVGGLVVLTLLELLLMFAVRSNVADPVVGVIRPIHLLALAACVTVFTSQNIYHQLREQVTNQFSFVLLILGFGSILVSFLAYAASTYELVAIAETEWLVGHIFFIIGLLQTIYILVNFGGYIRERLNIYYVMLIPRFIRFVIIWFTAAGAFILLEGDGNWRTYVHGVAHFHDVQGDQASLSDSTRIAIGHYQEARVLYSWNSKSSHNLASLSTGSSYTLSDLEQLAADSRSVYPFPYTTLNYANVLCNARQFDMAGNELTAALQQKSAAILHVNRAYVFRRQNLPDSVIGHLRQALLIDPSLAAQYANLAIVYLQNNRRENAQEFLQAGLRVDKNDPYVRTNAAFYSLLTDSLLFEPLETADTLHPTRTYNEALLAFRKGKYVQADTLVSGQAKGQAPDALLLRMLASPKLHPAPLDSSVVKFIAGYYPERAGIAWHNFGTWYEEQGVPEMAAIYYQLAGNAGIPKDRLNALLALADAGYHDAAYEGLMQLRINLPELRTEAEHEMNLLARAYGDEFIQLNWPLSTDELLRAGVYAGWANLPELASVFYNQLVKKDSTVAAPYTELGRIFAQRLDDAAALEQYKAGKVHFAKDPELNAEMARCLLRLNRKAEADKLFTEFYEANKTMPVWALAQAERLSLANQLDKGASTLEQALKAYPLNTKLILALAQNYRARGENQKGLQLLADAVRANQQNPDLWATYAYFAAHTAFSNDALPAMEKAMALARNKEDKARIQKQLEEIRLSLLES
jgi:tetratricopeptide (TPR) repeat protein